VPVFASAPDGRYRVTVSLADEGQAGAPPPTAELGELTVIARDLAGVRTEPPPTDVAVGAVFGGVAELVGVNVHGPAEAGAELAVELVWRSIAPAERPYKVTVQLLDELEQVVALHDGEPVGWQRPTTGWLPGEIVVDEHMLELPTELPDGDYVVIVGLYDPEALTRLPVAGAPTVDHAARVTTVRAGQ
jgi:hypothetical protein